MRDPMTDKLCSLCPATVDSCASAADSAANAADSAANAEKAASGGVKSLIKMKIANTLFGAMLLVLGLIFIWLFPDQQQTGAIITAISALVVSVPVLIYGIKGFLSVENNYITEQLVSIAILASMAQGDFLSATLIPIFLTLGHFLEEKSIMGVEEAIKSLKKLHSNQARVIIEPVKSSGRAGKNDDSDLSQTERLTDSRDLKKGDLIVCYPGDTIPCDGIVTKGETLINQAHITGESLPVSVFKGSRVFAGTVNLSSKFYVRVTDKSEESILNRVTKLLSEAEKSKAPIVKIIEKYISMYLPVVLMAAGITLFFTRELSRAVAILVISCPCALVLASPSAMIAALVIAARKGIMIKNTAFLETLADTDTLVFDKTGTLTFGRLELEKVDVPHDVTMESALKMGAFCAMGSLHPVSMALRQYAHDKGVFFDEPDSSREISGKGTIASKAAAYADGDAARAACVSGEKENFYLGKYDWVCEQTGDKLIQEFPDTGATAVWLASDTCFYGRFIFSDKLKPEAREAVEKCREMGVKRVVLITGDRADSAQKVGDFIKADQIVSGCLPQDKFEFIKNEKALGRKVMFVGDGINDALALKASHTGLAIGLTGSDIAIQSADIALNSSSLLNIYEVVRLSGITRRIIHENILIGTGFSLFMMYLASSGLITPVTGAFLHNFGSFFVIVNSARLLRVK
jgi:heavy metal translocating P-type ATPase